MWSLKNRTIKKTNKENKIVRKSKKKQLTDNREQASVYQWGESWGEGKDSGSRKKGLLWNYMKSCA